MLSETKSGKLDPLISVFDMQLEANKNNFKGRSNKSGKATCDGRLHFFSSGNVVKSQSSKFGFCLSATARILPLLDVGFKN